MNEIDKKIFEQLFEEINRKMKSFSFETKQDHTFNLFRVLGIENKEVLICRLLGDLLDPCGAHGLGYEPLKLFLQQLQKTSTSDEIDKIDVDVIKNASVILEDKANDDRRVDIAIYIDNTVIPIEVKIRAGDQKNQLWDYYNYYFGSSEDKKIYYLTPDRHDPSEDSLCGLNGHKPSEDSSCRLKGEQYKCLSFQKDITEWIDKILPSCNEQVKMILEQFREVIKDMCKQDEITKKIKEIILKDGQFKSNEYMKAMLDILAANQKNDLWGMIRKEYLRNNLESQIASDYKLIEPNEESDKHCIFEIIKSEKIVASICVYENLYITAKKLKSNHNKPWKATDNGHWIYFGINGIGKKCNLRDVNFDILKNQPIDINPLLEEIEN